MENIVDIELENSIKEQAALKAEFEAIQKRLEHLEQKVKVLQFLKNENIPEEMKEPIRFLCKAEKPSEPRQLPLTGKPDKGKKPVNASICTEQSDNIPSPVLNTGKDEKSPVVGLKPNSTGIQVQNKPDDQSPVSKQLDEAIMKAKNFYVVYNTDNAGIYTEWSIANSVTKGVPGVTHKKFKTFAEARASADLYTNSLGGKPIKLLRTAPMPQTYAEKAKMSPQERRPIQRIEFLSLNNHMFKRIWEMARTASERDVLDEKLWTRDVSSHSLFNFSQGASPDIIQQAFSAGLINAIYPSNNLQEIKKLPKPIFDAVRDFKNHILKRGIEDIFMEFSSILCDWVEGRYIPPVTIIKLGVLNKPPVYYPSEPKSPDFNPEQLIETRLIGYRQVLRSINPIRLNTGWRINICQDGVLMYSKRKANIDLQDLMRVEDFERDLKLNLCDGSRDTKKAICGLLQQLYPTNHGCYVCHPNAQKDEGSGSDLNEGQATPAEISPTSTM